MPNQNITILSPAHPYRGGIAAFTERLAHQLQAEGDSVQIYTFTLQYPSFLFPGKTQYSSEPAPTDLQIERRLSSVNPLTWISLGRRIRRQAPDVLVLAYWMPFMAPCMGTVARIARSNGKTRVIALCHNLIPHEKRPGDMLLTRWLINSLHGVMALSQSVCDDVHRFDGAMPTVASPHPLYDNFGQRATHDEGCQGLGLDPGCRYLLFFGLIRDYKGLDLLLNAFALCHDDPAMARYRLLIAGEFYSGEERYRSMATTLGIDDQIVWHTHFVPDSQVRLYFGAADIVVQPYKSATQSGVTQIAYHFGLPMLVTRVGGLPEIVPDGRAGYVADPDAGAIAQALLRFVQTSPDFSAGLAEERRKYTWGTFTARFRTLFNTIVN